MRQDCAVWRERSKDIGLLALRVLMGLAIAYHGYGKVFGGQVEMLAGGLAQWGWPMPTVFAWLAALSEFVGGLMIALGLVTRLGALAVLITMGVAFFKAHSADPFHVKEPAFLFGTIALALVFTGGGRYALESIWCGHDKDRPAEPPAVK